jgi:WD40 repeat protein/serine/threonine protein kinase
VGRGLLTAEPAEQVPEQGTDPAVAVPTSEPESRSLVDRIKPSLDVEPAGEMAGQKLERYKLLERVGEGGCGVVYVAEQTEPVRRRVALKVIKLGMDTKQVVARFEAEQQTLAQMDHPSIAKVFAAGATESGRPYFVMELVAGCRITDYCDRANLNTKERLELFIKVCQAIQHAHQKGIIHRDIKPSNILVTVSDAVAVPKVIDFGIAKATEGRLTDATVYTQLHQLIGTPAYMSPEQAEMSGVDIDTRSDIYSLGVLLYELLAGSTPFDAKELVASGVDAMRKTIREKQPPRPSTKLSQTLVAAKVSPLKSPGGKPGTEEEVRADSRRLLRLKKTIPLLRGDLDWIVMKCLEKDRRRRYETANALAMDIQRHLNIEPVVARPPNRLYEFQKTVRRHKSGFAAVTALILVLTAGVLTSTWQAFEATRARKAEVKERIAAQAAQAQAAAQQKAAEAERQRAEAQLTRAEWLVYAGKLLLAQNDFQDGNGGLALHYLNECQEKLCGWEYRYLLTRFNARQTLVGHTGEVLSAEFSPDGKRIVTGSKDRTAKVWDAATGQEILALKGHALWLTSVAFSPDSKRAVTGAGEWGRPDKTPGEAKVWDAATGQELLALQGHADCVWTVGFSPDGQHIVTASEDRTAKVWDAATGQEILTLRGFSAGVRSAAFSPDGRRIVTGSQEETARVWDAATGKELLALKHPNVVTSVAFSPDGQRIVTGCEDKTAKVWDGRTGEVILVLKHPQVVWGVAFSPDGKRIVTGSWDQTAKVWDAATGQEVFTLKGHAGNLRSVAFSPDGKRIVTGCGDGTARVWDAEKGQEVPTLEGHMDFVSSIAISPDGKRIVTGSGDGTARVWDAAKCQEILTLGGPASREWKVAAVWGVAFSPDGQRIVTGSQDQTARVWDAATGQELLVLKHTNVVSSVAFSPDGQRIVTGVGEWGRPNKKPGGEAKVWDTATGQELLVLKHPDDVSSVAFSPDGKRIATGCLDRTARMWDAATGQELLVLEHSNLVSSVAFSPDGKRVVTGGFDRTAKVWDAATGLELLVLKGHTGCVRSVAFSPDGTRIVTGSDDWTAKVWEAATGQEVLTLKHPTSVWSVAFSPDGQRLVTGMAGADAIAKVWFAATTPQMAAWEQAEPTGEERLAPARVDQKEQAVK